MSAVRVEEEAPGVAALHVFSLSRHAQEEHTIGDGASWRVLLSSLLAESSEAGLSSDPYGRVNGHGADMDVAVCVEQQRQFVALMQGSSVAISGRVIPDWVDASSLLPFSASERSFIEAAPQEVRMSRLAQLWTRKEASLRLSGGGFSRANEVDVLCEGRDGKVVVPEAGPGSWYGSRVAYVHDVPTEAGFVVSVATSSPVRDVYVWQLDALPVPVMAAAGHADRHPSALRPVHSAPATR
ncbi:hypothetical protein GCM10010329_69360 [Streptomyces spiroverticillatus]|uniref:4'-phosphopantetheinyl transferase superfamily protein n=1 Tax=Streptomyces finlayi TaxID=67296 RepID=A0A918X5V0_9ACTN|nr:4'-phosphopantetheinyl transferase superfamily protein [Streptomyces finlayi]GHA36172.1 hypothetical protein GCM10010329_69360 [Streptomyces spiroverticillatus]GHD12398.1 hypothetical protein GCM10010334_69320 [Streptomyces finlayi]